MTPGHAHPGRAQASCHVCVGPIDHRPDRQFRGRPYVLLGAALRYQTRAEAQTALEVAALNPRYRWRVEHDRGPQYRRLVHAAYTDLQDAVQCIRPMLFPGDWLIWDRREVRYYYPPWRPVPEAAP